MNYQSIAELAVTSTVNAIAFGVTVRAVIGFLAHNQGSFVAAFESASFTDVGIAHGFESRLGSPCGSNAEILSEFDGTVKRLEIEGNRARWPNLCVGDHVIVRCFLEGE